jgi:hypothetical protein
VLAGDGSVTRDDGVNVLLVKSPQLVHIHQVDGLAESLIDDKVGQSLDGETASVHALNGREARIIPTIDKLLIDEPLKLSLRQESVAEVQTTVILDLDRAQLHGLLELFK